MEIRRANPRDADAVSRLYYDTVHRVNARDYGPGHIEAWAPRVYPAGFWHRRWRRYQVFVAVEGGEVLGFAELSRDGEIDCFYTHYGHQGRGVGRALMDRLVAVARRRGLATLEADVSLTARPFFERMGFRVLRPQKKFYRGRAFKQFRMRHRIRAHGARAGVRGSNNGVTT